MLLRKTVIICKIEMFVSLKRSWTHIQTAVKIKGFHLQKWRAVIKYKVNFTGAKINTHKAVKFKNVSGVLEKQGDAVSPSKWKNKHGATKPRALNTRLNEIGFRCYGDFFSVLCAAGWHHSLLPPSVLADPSHQVTRGQANINTGCLSN